jgi:hypothetical protein
LTGAHASQASSCNRAEQLVPYLYGEASAAETEEFERHAHACDSCRAEMADFGVLRQAIGDWRTEALGGLFPAGARELERARVFDSSIIGPTGQRRSAFAALREFFALSPAWMRAATAFAIVAFCALAVFAFTHLFQRPSQQQPTQAAASGQPSEKVYTEQQVKEMLARARQEAEAARGSTSLGQEPRAIETASGGQTPKPVTLARHAGRNANLSSPALAKSSPTRGAGNSISTRERQQLAEVLLPQETKDEEKLPRLSDLLGNDSN